MSRRMILVTICILVSVALLLSGCGGRSEPREESEPPRATSEETEGPGQDPFQESDSGAPESIQPQADSGGLCATAFVLLGVVAVGARKRGR